MVGLLSRAGQYHSLKWYEDLFLWTDKPNSKQTKKPSQVSNVEEDRMNNYEKWVVADRKTLLVQRDARNMVKGYAKTIKIILILETLLFFVFLPFLLETLPIYWVILIPAILYGILKLMINWCGWTALRTYKLHCPSCKKPLYDERVNIFKSGDHHCQHCGKLALAPIEQLEQLYDEGV